ncbi:hypothetical protein PFICI_03636 [Pestalotiopsis fici W106-1]|uniref:Uncharacterized protein n=1 Tax=Pestalotiopsis fici (strain W106-1 / CGMCC3.15140) TaxID=1229662 RepID=W3XK46_PESFW|nr:uncharacterized protein PFICI_03636 [Pestalotiopsis fici W106-1]ETS85611.1 hypothetical protein PFICI_03636 [Pestalotiopsis fici W106-1]
MATPKSTVTRTTSKTSSAPGSTTIIIITSTKSIDGTLAPLTTTFIPPSSCFDRYYQENSSSVASVITSGTLDPSYNGCQLHNRPELTYSPGMCPGRMTTAARQLNGDHFTEWCCQSGYSYDPRGCGSVVASRTTVPIYPTSDNTQHSATVTSVVAVHEAVTIIWASTDLNLFPSDVASSRSALFSDSNTTTGLTQAAKIGIGVGVAVGALIILTVGSAWLIKVMRQKKRHPKKGRNVAGELDGDQKIWKRFFGREWRAELPPDGLPAELATEPANPAELAVQQIPVELPTGGENEIPGKPSIRDGKYLQS